MAVNFALWHDIKTGFGGFAHLGGVRGIREVIALHGIIALAGFYLWRKHKWISLLIIWASLNGLYHVARGGAGSVYTYHDLCYLATFAIWYVISKESLTQKFQLVAAILVSLGIFNAIWAGFQLMNWDPVWIVFRPVAWNRMPTGWLDNNTNLVHFLAMVMPLATLFSWWLLIPLALPIILAAKTLPILAAVLGIIIAKRLKFVAIGLLAAGAIYIGIFDPPREAMKVRWEVLKETNYLASFRPLTGFGVGSFKRIYPQYIWAKAKMSGKETTITGTDIKGPTLPTENVIYYHPSNEIVKAIFELGWPVLVLLSVAFLSILRRIRRAKPDKWRDAYAGASVAFLVTMMGYQPLAIPPLALSGLMVWAIYEGRLKA